MLMTEKERETILTALNTMFHKNSDHQINPFENLKFKFDYDDVLWVLAQLFPKLQTVGGLNPTHFRNNEQLTKQCIVKVGRFIGDSLHPGLPKPTLDIFTSFPEYGDIIRKEIEAAQTKINPSRELAMKRAAQFYALMVLFSDGYFQFTEEAAIQQDNFTRRFFAISSKLSLDIQMLLALRVINSCIDGIIQNISEQAFRYQVNQELLEKDRILNGNDFTIIAIREFKDEEEKEAITLRLQSSNERNAVIMEGISKVRINMIADAMPHLEVLTFMSPPVKPWSIQIFPKKIKDVNFFYQVTNQYATITNRHNRTNINNERYSTLEYWDKSAPDLYFWSKSSLQLGRELTLEIIGTLSPKIMHLILHHKPTKDLLQSLPDHIKTVQYYDNNELCLIEKASLTTAEKEKLVNNKFITKNVSWGAYTKVEPLITQNNFFTSTSTSKKSLKYSELFPDYEDVLEELSDNEGAPRKS